MYIMKKYDIENRVAINEGPSKRKLVKSLTKGSNVTFKLNGGRVITGQINCLEREGAGYYFSGTFKDSTMKYKLRDTTIPRPKTISYKSAAPSARTHPCACTSRHILSKKYPASSDAGLFLFVFVVDADAAKATSCVYVNRIFTFASVAFAIV